MADEVLRAVHRGSITAVENTLRAFKGGIDRSVLNEALLRAVWLNRVEIIERLLEEGASPDSQDEESGWSSLHRALYWGYMHSAALLLESGAQLNVLDCKGRTALDLLSVELKGHLLDAAAEGEVYTWGNGANYQLGSGAVGLQLAPVRLEALHGMSVQAVAAAKFHSAAITKDGQLYTWGFGRGGRLGHADFHIHSGQSASILPQQVAFFGRRQVLKVAAAKHHSAAITSAGELFTWGSNRDGRLGYQSVDTQPNPRKITTFNRQKVAAVAVANRHTVALLDGGYVFSWGSNLQGQLGYGTTDSASNAIPRVVEALKGKNVKAIAAAKRHTVILTEDGDVFTWGHQKVTPRRVVLSGSRDVARATAQAASSGGWKVVFHNGQSEVSRPEAVVIAAGAAHSSAVTRDGVVLAWRSMDPALRPQEVGGPLAGKKVVSISAGKYRTAVVTSEGDVFMWEGWSKAAEAVPKRSASQHVPGSSPMESFPPEWEISKGLQQRKPGKAQAFAFQLITPQRVEGLKRVTGIAVGEKHSIALQSWCAAPIFLGDAPTGPPAESPSRAESLLSPRGSAASALEDADIVSHSSIQGSVVQCVQSDAYWDALELAVQARDAPPLSSPRRVLRRPGSARREGPISLQQLCERRVAEGMVEPRTVLQVLEFADAAGAQALKTHCLWVALSNLDVVLLESRGQFEQLLPHVLEEMTQHWTARFPRAVVAPVSPEASSLGPQIADHSPKSVAQPSAERSFRIPREEAEAADRARQERTIRKKLQQIDTLQRRADESPLDSQQQAKLALRPTLLSALQALQSNRPAEEVRRMLAAAQSSVPSTPKPVPPIGGHTEGRASRRRSRSGLSSAGTSPTPTSSVQSPQELASRSMTGTSPTNSDSSAVTRYRPTPTRLAMDSSLPDSVPRVSGFGGSSPACKWPVPQKGFAEPSSSSAQASASALATLHEEDQDKVGVLDAAAARLKAGKPSGQASGSSKPPGNSGKKPAKRKGGLSMFLSGQLEQQPEPKPTPLPQQKTSHLTWALQAQKSPLSLRDILDKEAAQSFLGSQLSPSPSNARQHQRVSSDWTPRQAGKAPASGRTGSVAMQSSRASDDGSTASGMTVSLGDLVKKSKPIAVSKAAAAAAPERGGPAWGNVPGGSPQTGRTRLQDIQAEQELARESLSRSWGPSGVSPKSHRGSHYPGSSSTWRLQSAAGTSPGTNFPAGTSPSSGRKSLAPAPQPQSKWYIKEEQEIVPLRAIQTEESAVKELAALYGDGNVRRLPKQKPPRN